MDRFSIPATILTAITVCAALAGCTVGSSDEYRTFEEVQAEKQAQVVEPAEGVPAVPEDVGLEGEGSEADPSESIERAAFEEIPSNGVPKEELLAADVVHGANDSNLTSGSLATANPAPPPAATDAADGLVPAEEAIGDPPSNVTPASEGVPASEGDPSSNKVSLRPDEGSVPDVATAAREIKLLVPEKSFNTEGAALRVSYDDLNLLTILNMEPVPPNPEPHFPGWLNELEGRRIRIRGFMYPAFLETGLRGFILVRDNQECCFGPGAKIYDHIEVSMRDGVTTDYIPGRPFDVVGRFHIRPEADDEELYQLYQIEDALVIDD